MPTSSPFLRGLCVVLLLGALVPACTEDESVADDLALSMSDDSISSCYGLTQCLASCLSDGGTGCADRCNTRATAAARAARQAADQCVAAACDQLADGGEAICSDPMGLECERCRINSVRRAPGECADAPSYCGQCYDIARDCYTQP